MLVKIEEVYLYTTLDHTHAECYAMKQWLDSNNVRYTNLHYPAEMKEEVFAPLNTWWEGVTFKDFPLLVYTEVHDEIPVSRSPRKFAKTLADAQSTDFLTYAPKR